MQPEGTLDRMEAMQALALQHGWTVEEFEAAVADIGGQGGDLEWKFEDLSEGSEKGGLNMKS